MQEDSCNESWSDIDENELRLGDKTNKSIEEEIIKIPKEDQEKTLKFIFNKKNLEEKDEYQDQNIERFKKYLQEK
jgi:hypothetical protein